MMQHPVQPYKGLSPVTSCPFSVHDEDRTRTLCDPRPDQNLGDDGMPEAEDGQQRDGKPSKHCKYFTITIKAEFGGYRLCL